METKKGGEIVSMSAIQRYPRLEVDLEKIIKNAQKVTSYASERGLTITGVIKGCNAIVEVGDAMLKGGCSGLATSRMDQMQRIHEALPEAETWLLRIPMLSEIETMIRCTNVSLNSEAAAVRAIEAACGAAELTHKVLLMADLGDLREGFRDFDEMVALAEEIETQMSHVTLLGIGTNLGCYGSISPTRENLTELVNLARRIEARIGRRLQYVSGGATTTLPLLLKGGVPEGINHLRVGEGILLGRDLEVFWNTPFPGVEMDAFTLKAEIVEVKEKPSYPIGEIFVDAFGEVPVYHDEGLRLRAIAAVGKQDIGSHEKLIVRSEGMRLIGSSSDHLILDVTEMPDRPKVGDIVTFDLFYPAMLYLSGSASVAQVMRHS